MECHQPLDGNKGKVEAEHFRKGWPGAWGLCLRGNARHYLGCVRCVCWSRFPDTRLASWNNGLNHRFTIKKRCPKAPPTEGMKQKIFKLFSNGNQLMAKTRLELNPPIGKQARSYQHTVWEYFGVSPGSVHIKDSAIPSSGQFDYRNKDFR
jgi:hypothetical protein